MASCDLPELSAFAPAYEVTVGASSEDDTTETRLVAVMNRSVAVPCIRAAMKWEFVESGEASLADLAMTVSAGVRKEGFFCGLNVYRSSPAAQDKLLRAKLFHSAIRAMALEDDISVSFDNDTLRMEARAPWTLHYPVGGWGGTNPIAFEVCGFGSFDDALTAATRLRQILHSSTRCGFMGRYLSDSYRNVAPQLNAIWQGWYVEVVGSLSRQAIDVLNEDVLDSREHMRIPAFLWWEGKSQVFGAVVVEDGKCFLEMSTDSHDKDLLATRTSGLGLQFIKIL